MNIINKIYIIFSILLLSSCAKIPYYPEPFGTFNYTYNKDDNKLALKNNGYKTLAQKVVASRSNPIVNIATIEQYHKVQNYYIDQFSSMSVNLPKITSRSPQLPGEISVISAPISIAAVPKIDAQSETIPPLFWKEVAANGINYVDAVCHDYLRQINRLKKNTKGLKRLTVNSGYATAEILALTLGSAANPSRILGVLASAFGLGAGVFDIYEDTILFHAEFSGIYTMLDVLKDKQRTASQSVRTRSQAVQAIQDYLFVCTPHAIEAAINAKIGGKIPSQLVDVLGISDFSSRGAKLQKEEIKRLADLLLEIIKNSKT